MYRIYDGKNKRWFKTDEACVNKVGNLLVFTKSKIFDAYKIEEHNREEYEFSVDRKTDFVDNFGYPIYENDIVEIGNVVGLIGWNNSDGAFVLLDYKEKSWYDLWDKLCETKATLIGSIEENPDLIDMNGLDKDLFGREDSI